MSTGEGADGEIPLWRLEQLEAKQKRGSSISLGEKEGGEDDGAGGSGSTVLSPAARRLKQKEEQERVKRVSMQAHLDSEAEVDGLGADRLDSSADDTAAAVVAASASHGMADETFRERTASAEGHSVCRKAWDAKMDKLRKQFIAQAMAEWSEDFPGVDPSTSADWKEELQEVLEDFEQERAAKEDERAIAFGTGPDCALNI